MNTTQLVTLIVAIASHAGWITALVHSIQTRKMQNTTPVKTP